MESSIKCVFCNSKRTNDKLVAFTVHTLKKCREVLDIRKKFNLKYKDVILPASECNDGYHIKCHKMFLAVMKKYYEKKAVTSSDISVQTDEPIPSTSSAHEIEQTHQEGQSAIQEPSGEKLTEAALSVEQDICAFCNKKYKKSKGRQAPLVRGEKKILIEALAEYLDVVRDSEFFKSLSNEPQHLFYHKICRVEYFNKFKSNPTADTKFNLNRELHKEADDEIDQFIQKNIIARGSCFFLISLGEIYDDILKKLYEDRGYSYDGSCNLQHLLNKILDKFSDEIKVSAFRNKNVILPKNKFIDDGLFSLLQEDEILQKAAFILRRRILNIEKKPLSSNVK